MPPQTLPDDTQLDFLDNTELDGEDLVKVWDRSRGVWAWTTLTELNTWFTNN